MRCKTVLTQIDALRTGELGPGESSPVREHLETCTSCSDSLHDVDALARTVRTLASAPVRSCRETMVDSFGRLEHDGESIWVGFSGDGLRMIRRGGTADDFRRAYAKRHCHSLKEAPIDEPLRKQVLSALEGSGVANPKVDWESASSDLEREVLGTLTKIPRGEVRTYEWVARQVGRPRAVRAVGSILAKNIVPFVVPCHRVVPATGGIGNYAFGPEMKRELLRREGVDVEGLERLGRSGIRYVGSRTTKIFCFPTCRDAKRIREENRVPFHEASEAIEKGFRPCMHCQPCAAA